LELDGKAVPVADLIELLAEWARDVRQEQRGLMLLTAHRAKGLEFDDVVILDGGWDRYSKGEDRDAPRRLFYVAMTRARRSLAIMATRERHPLVGPDTQGILQRQMARKSDEGRDHALRYHLVEPQMVDLSWTGRQGRGHPVHQALEGLRTDDPVNLVDIGGRWMLQNVQGISVGRMAKGYHPPDGLRFVRGKARSIIRWRKMDNGEEYQDSLRSDEWEVVLPELVFA
jgi:ATP-dependent DNA helicase RecQ